MSKNDGGMQGDSTHLILWCFSKLASLFQGKRCPGVCFWLNGWCSENKFIVYYSQAMWSPGGGTLVSLCANSHGAKSHCRIVGSDDAHTVLSIVFS